MREILDIASNLVFALALLFTGLLMLAFAVDPAAAAQLLVSYVTDGVL